jgi:hypothetical protein
MTIAIGVLLSSILFRGTKAVNVTQKQQMFVIMSNVDHFSHTSLSAQRNDICNALHIAGANDKMNIVNFPLILKKNTPFGVG